MAEKQYIRLNQNQFHLSILSLHQTSRSENKELLDSQQGPQGGYSLTKSAENISVREVIEAMEGPIALTECSDDGCGCAYETNCAVGKPWQKINKVINDVLQNINLAEMGMKDESQKLIKLTDITEMSF